jgi:hypothetical protein
MKLVLAAILAGSFLVSLPVKADDKPADDSGKAAKKSKKGDKGDKGAKKGDDDAKTGGGGW